MFCFNCGSQLSDGAKFCVSCGAPVAPNNVTNGANTPPNVAPQQTSPVITNMVPQQVSPVITNQEKKKSKAPIIIVISLFAVLLIAVIILLCILLLKNNNDTSGRNDTGRNNFYDWNDPGSGSSDKNASDRDASDRDASDRETSSDHGISDNSFRAGASSMEEALENFFDAVNSTDRDAALVSLHPIYGAVLNADNDLIYDFICDVATTDMYMLLAETFNRPDADATLQFRCIGFEIDEQEIANDEETISYVNTYLEYWYDYLEEEYGDIHFASADWKVDSYAYCVCNSHISVYGEDDYETMEALVVEISENWYVLSLDF